MKALHAIPALLLLSLSLLPLQAIHAQHGKQHGHQNSHQGRLLMHLLKMDSAELAELRRTLVRIEGMTPEEKQAFSKSVQRLHDMPPETAQKLYQSYHSIPPEQREAMHQRWREMTPEQRHEWRQRMNALEPAERLKQIQKEGILPGPRYGGKREGLPISPKKSKRITAPPEPSEPSESDAPPEEN